MSTDFAAIQNKLRKEIEGLEKERREGDAAYENKMQAIAEARERFAAARGDGDKVTMMKDEMKAKLLAQKRDILLEFKEKNDEELELLQNLHLLIQSEIKKVHEDKKGQQKIYLLLREQGVAEFQNYSPGPLSEISDDEPGLEEPFTKQPSFSGEIGNSGTMHTDPDAEIQVNIAGDAEEGAAMESAAVDGSDMYEPTVSVDVDA